MQIKNLFVFAIFFVAFSDNQTQFDCSAIEDITQCQSSSDFCYVVEANVTYFQISDNNTKVEEVILDQVNDKCRTLNFYTVCDQLYKEKSCKLGNCFWDPKQEKCYRWDSATCQSYPKTYCQWNHQCELINQTQTLQLNYNYTLMNDVDINQQDGRQIGSWLYEFGLIIDVSKTENEGEEKYTFTMCVLKNRCEFIQITDFNQADFQCSDSGLNCYFDVTEGKCKKISALTECHLIKWESKCNSGAAPCIWINNKCQIYDQKVDNEFVSCTLLDLNRCLNIENCYIQGDNCRSYQSCADFKTKNDCDNTSIYYCYFDDYETECKPLTRHIQCKKIVENHCKDFSHCKYNEANKICEEILQDFYCQKFQKEDCNDKSNDKTQNCEWNENLQLCNWIYGTQNCDGKTINDCDHLDCYYDNVMGTCSTIQYNTDCEFLGQNACSYNANKIQNKCQWSESRNLCLSIFDFGCEELSETFCKYLDKCFVENKTCKTRRQCKDNITITDCLDDKTQHCYFDKSQQLCRRITLQTPCNLIYKEISCNQAICSWSDDKCVSVENVNCEQIANQNCKYSSKCLLQNDKCIPLDICEKHNGKKQDCESDVAFCFYNPDTLQCKNIDGTTKCSQILGGRQENCLHAKCSLSRLSNLQYQCTDYEFVPCDKLSKEQCNFGKCTYYENECVPYPFIIQEKPLDNPTVIPEPEEEENVYSFYLTFFINLLIIILE